MKPFSKKFKKETRHAVPLSERLLSVDVFRGATIAAMFLVECQGGTETYAMFKHSEWSGLTFTDCIAPCFMWIVGISLSISLSKRLVRGDSPGKLFAHTVRRAIILFGIGVALNLWLPALTAVVRLDVHELDSWLLMGTLQRIAIGYLIASVIILWASDVKKQITFGCVLLIAYTSIFYLAPAPGFLPGDFSAQGNAVTYLDRQILGTHGNLSHPVLNSIPAAAMILFGAMVGKLLTWKGSRERKVGLVLVCGGFSLIVGLGPSKLIPINYRLWTPSFVMTVGGIACICIGLLYSAVEVKGVRFGMKPLSILGMNPILMWVLAVVSKSLLGAKGFVDDEGKWRSIWVMLSEIISHPRASAELNSTLFAVVFMGLLYPIAHFLYSRGIIVRI